MRNGPGSLNRIYRLVWNEATQAWVAVAELTRSRGKRSSGTVGALVVSALLTATAAYAVDPPPVSALPTGGAVAAGMASIGQNGNAMNIVQGSDRAAINWQTFNIGANASVNFQQPSASSMILNRVMSADPSAIFGSLTANGQVALVNPNGIVFGAGSRVDVGGLVASSLAISNADFMAGRLNFSRGDATGAVTNKGTLTAATQGYIAMLAPEVRNEGVISARMGTVALAAGDAVTLDMSGTGLMGVRVDAGTINTLVENRHMVQAEGGQVILSAGAANRLLQQAVAGASGASQLVEIDGKVRLVNAGGDISASGGQIKIEGSTVSTQGSIDVSGAQAGNVNISGDFVAQSGAVKADATVSVGGRIVVSGGTVIQTASTKLSADGAAGGGRVNLTGADAAAKGTVYSSATISARGTGATADGGKVDITAGSVQLRAATVDASGQGNGGHIRVGGGFRGQETDIANAGKVGVNASTELIANAGVNGDGGKIAVWADGTTLFGGGVTARGGSASGNGGRAEVSGKQNLGFDGRVDLSAPKGRAGQFELDPHDIIIDNPSASIASLSLDDPNAASTRDNHFASNVTILDNGNVVITAPNTAVGSAAGAGAVYLYNSRNGSLLNQLYGSQSQDYVGSGGVTKLIGGNYLVLSPLWNKTSAATTVFANPAGTFKAFTSADATAGAITWQSGAPAGSTGASGTGGSAAVVPASSSGSIVSASNSLVGNNATFDRVGHVGSNVVDAILIEHGTTAVNMTSSTTLTTLSDGNIVISMPSWNNGRGAVTWMNTATGQLGDGSSGGQVSASNSLVGSTGYRTPAIIVTQATKNFYVSDFNTAGSTSNVKFTGTPSPSSNGFANVQEDPLTVGLGDGIGQTVKVLSNGNFVTGSPNWTNTVAGAPYAGAVTWGGAGNRTGAVSASNSVVGDVAFSAIGAGGIEAVGATVTGTSNRPNYVVLSPYYGGSNGFFSTDFKGAVTWVNGSTGIANGASSTGAIVSATNSLVGDAGASAGAQANGTTLQYTYSVTQTSPGSIGTTRNFLTNVRLSAGGSPLNLTSDGTALIGTAEFSGGKGALTVIQPDGTLNGTLPAVGVLSSSNSLVGTLSSDAVGSGQVLELSGNRAVVNSTSWGSGRGAVTLLDLTTGGLVGSGVVGGVISATNSLTGSAALDNVGSGGVVGVGTPDTAGRYPNYLVLSPYWGRSAQAGLDSKGAVTWGSGTTGVVGVVSASNSLVGDVGDFVGSVVPSFQRVVSGNVTSTSGLLFINEGLFQFSGSYTATPNATVTVLPTTGNFVVSSAHWNSGRGAVTWGDGMSGVAGLVGSSNSLIGSTARVVSTSTVTRTHEDTRSFVDTLYTETSAGDFVGLTGKALSNGAYVVASPFWDSGRGAITWISPSGQFSTAAGGGAAKGTISASNSLVGVTPAVNTTTPATGNDAGDTSLGGSSLLPVFQASMGDNAGAVIEKRVHFNVLESVLASNSSQGTTAALPQLPFALVSKNETRRTGGGQNQLTGFNYSVFTPLINLRELSSIAYFAVGSPGWDGSKVDAGAMTLGSNTTGLAVGALTSGNSLVGGNDYDRIGRFLSSSASAGGTQFTDIGAGNFLVVSPGWNNGSTSASYNANNGMGAITWSTPAAGLTGEISTSNSLLGSTAGDLVGSGSFVKLTDGNVVIRSSNWKNGGLANTGAVTFINAASGLTGLVGPGNSLVGTTTGDAVGNNGITALTDGSYVVVSPNWNNGSTSLVGAVTYGPAGTGVTGSVSASNSLVGTQSNDRVGSFNVTSLPGGAYVVLSANWAHGSAANAGAVTYGAGGSGVVGAVSASNSLVGTLSSDFVGSSGIRVLKDQAASFANYLVLSPLWNDYNLGVSTVGAVTWVNGSTGNIADTGARGGRVGVANSLLGAVQGDGVGNNVSATSVSLSGVSTLTGDAIMTGSGRAGDGFGRFTLLPGTYGVTGYISSRNSLIGFNNTPANGTGAIQSAILPYAATALEKVAYRPLVWTTQTSIGSNGRRFVNASADNPKGVLVASLVTETASQAASGLLGSDSVSVSAGDGSDWNTVNRLISSVSDLNAYGLSGGTLPFTAGGNGSDAVISPAVITSILNAGTDLTLQANNNITVAKPIVVSSSSGRGGNLTLQAGRSVRLLAPISTDNGNLIIRANDSVGNGVVAADASSSLSSIAQIVMAENATVDAGSGYVAMYLLSSTDKAKTLNTATRNGSGPFNYTFGTSSSDANSSGNIILGSITASELAVVNEGGTNTVSNFGNIRTNLDSHLAFEKSGSSDGTIYLGAYRNVLLGGRNASQTVRIGNAMGASGEFNVYLNSALGPSGSVVLNNATISTANGDVFMGGGTPDSSSRPSGLAVGNTVTLNDLGSVNLPGVQVTGTSSINALTGTVSMAGRSPIASADGLNLQGGSSSSPITVNGGQVSLYGTYAGSGTSTGMSLGNATIGGAQTNLVQLVAEGFNGSTKGSININSGVTLSPATGASLTVASLNASALATYGGSSAPASGLWIKDTQLATLLQAATGFSDVTLGGTPQTGASSVQGLDLAAMFSSTPAPFNLTIAGGQGGLSINQNITQGLASDKLLKLEVGNGGTLDLTTVAVTSDKVLLAASGAGSQITQASGSFITTPSLRLDAADADVNLDQINQFTTVAGTIGQGKVVTGQTLTVGTTQGVSGLTSNGDVLVRTIFGTTDLQVDQPIISTNGNITAVTERNFFNTVASDQGLQTPAGRYLVYSAAPTTLPSSSVNARGMSTNFSKHYAQTFTGTTPSYATTGNWFLYANTPTITVSPGSGSSVYGAATSTGAVSITGLIDGDAESDALTGTPIVSGGTFTASGAGHRPVGSYNVSLTGLGTLTSPMGYAINLSSGTGTLTVTPLDVTLSGSRVYNRTGVVSGTSLNQVVGALSGDTVSVDSGLQATVADANVGNGKALTFTNSLRLSGADAGNYNVTGGTVDITARPVNVTANARSKVYGESDPSLTFTAQNATGNQGLVSGDSFSGALSRASGETVNGGPYAISQGTLANSNYTISFTGNSLTITPRPVNVTGDAKTKVYGENDPLFTFTSEAQSAGRGLKTGDTLSGSLTRASGETVSGGPYAITRGTLANSNYAISFSNGALTITPRPINVTADDTSKVYGENDPLLTFTSEAQSAGRGLKTGDTLTGALSRANGETVDGGPYTITQGTVANSNYAISFANGALTITRRPVEIIADSKTKVYGESDPALTFVAETQTVGRGLKTGDTFTGALTRASGENVSSTGYVISQGSLVNTNYDISVIGSFLQITPRPVNVTADNKTKVYGDADPTLTFVAEGVSAGRGLKAGDVLTGAPVRAAGETVAGGPYAIGQGTVDNANYAVNFINGALTITRRPLTVTADDKERLFGDKDPVFTFTVNPSQLAFADTGSVVQGVEYETRRGISVPPGDYPIVITAGSADNYQLSFVDGELTVKPVAMIRSENLIVQQAPQGSGQTSAPAPSVTTPSASAPTVTSAQPGMLTMRDGGLSAGAAPTMTAATAAPASMGLAPAAGAFQVAVVTRPAGGTDGLIANTPIPQARVDVGTAFKVEIPQAAFASTRADAKVTLSATAADGTALPSWVKFDAQSGKVEGTPPAGFKGDLAVKVVARDERGNEAVQTLTISVGK